MPKYRRAYVPSGSYFLTLVTYMQLSKPKANSETSEFGVWNLFAFVDIIVLDVHVKLAFNALDVIA